MSRFAWKDWEYLDEYVKLHEDKLKKIEGEPKMDEYEKTEYIMKTTVNGTDEYRLVGVFGKYMVNGDYYYIMVQPQIVTYQNGTKILESDMEERFIKGNFELYEKPADLKPPPSTKPRKRALTIGGKKSRKNKKSRKLRKKTIKN